MAEASAASPAATKRKLPPPPPPPANISGSVPLPSSFSSSLSHSHSHNHNQNSNSPSPSPSPHLNTISPPHSPSPTFKTIGLSPGGGGTSGSSPLGSGQYPAVVRPSSGSSSGSGSGQYPPPPPPRDDSIINITSKRSNSTTNSPGPSSSPSPSSSGQYPPRSALQRTNTALLSNSNNHNNHPSHHNNSYPPPPPPPQPLSSTGRLPPPPPPPQSFSNSSNSNPNTPIIAHHEPHNSLSFNELPMIDRNNSLSNNNNSNSVAPSPMMTPNPTPPLKPPRHSRTVSAQISLEGNNNNVNNPSHNDEKKAQLETIEYYFRQAIQANNTAALRDLLLKSNDLNINNDLIATATALVKQKDSEAFISELATLKHYLKQGVEHKNKDVLKLALEKVEPVLASMTAQTRRLHVDFFQLVDDAKKVMSSIDKESASTINFYLKQGIQLRSREVLKEAVDKAAVTTNNANTAALVDKDLLNQAKSLLSELDCQHMIRGFIRAAVQAKDDVALENALNQSIKLKISPTDNEIVEATRLLADLRAKLKKDQKTPASKAAKKWFGISSSSKDKNFKNFRLFGGPLVEAVRLRGFEGVPKVMHQCITFLRGNALTEPGLFRVPGNKDNMEGIQSQFEADLDVTFDDVHDVAGVLKQYLRSLQEPLIPYDHYAAFIKVGNIKGNDSDRKKGFKELVEKLPNEFKAVLTYLIGFLFEVSLHSSVNKMSPDNLAIVFAPNLIRPKVETPNTMMIEMPVAISVIASFITNFKFIFNVPNSTSDPSSTSSIQTGKTGTEARGSEANLSVLPLSNLNLNSNASSNGNSTRLSLGNLDPAAEPASVTSPSSINSSLNNLSLESVNNHSTINNEAESEKNDIASPLPVNNNLSAGDSIISQDLTKSFGSLDPIPFADS